jgi:ABC-2 type transport system ATP-binding protein
VTEPAILMRNVVKRYGERLVLDGVDLEVGHGEVVCLLGPNGAGKTTTIEILEGYREATSGEVRVLGFDPSTHALGLRERTGVVLQECGFPNHLRVGELLDGWRAYYRRPRALEELLDLVELRQERETLVRRLSGGQRRRLDFALALAGNPDLIFLDEPTTGFDPEARRRCWSAIENLRTLDKSILLTTHYLDEAERLADRVAILGRGNIRASGTPRQLSQRAAMPTLVSFTVPVAVADGTVNLPRALDATVTGDRVVARTTDSTRCLISLLEWARRHCLGDLDGLSVTPPTLEDVYLELVGPEEALVS